jgi:hypothetical protein
LERLSRNPGMIVNDWRKRQPMVAILILEIGEALIILRTDGDHNCTRRKR